jgi:uncharacterized damage-inducible protein DinB
MAWADQRTLESLRAMREPPPQAVDLFAHGLAATHVWIRRIEHAPAAYEVWPKLSLDECERLAHANHATLAALAVSDERALAALVHYTNLSGRTFDTPLEDILLHLTHHAMYHRGQVALLMRASGGAPIGTDYITFVRP